MATITLVQAEDFEDGDLVDLSDYVDDGDLHTTPAEGEYSRVDGDPEDIDRWRVKLHTNHGTVEVERSTYMPYKSA